MNGERMKKRCVRARRHSPRRGAAVKTLGWSDHWTLRWYLLNDARCYLALKRTWGDTTIEHLVKERTDGRIQQAILHADAAKGKHMALLDFSLGTDSQTAPTVQRRDICAICLDSLAQTGASRREIRCLPCGHAFHDDCLAGDIRHDRHEDRGAERDGRHRDREAERSCPECRQIFTSTDRALGKRGQVKNLHPTHPLTSQRPPERKQRQACRNIISTGYCSFGLRCRFSHDV